MSRSHVCDTKEIFHQTDNYLPFRLSRMKEIEGIFIDEINNKEK